MNINRSAICPHCGQILSASGESVADAWEHLSNVTAIHLALWHSDKAPVKPTLWQRVKAWWWK